MAAFDATSTAGGLNISSLSWSQTCSGADRVLTVGVNIFDVAAPPIETVSSITYPAGTNLTVIGSGITNGFNRVEQWRLIAPATGANTVLVTITSVVEALTAGAVSATAAHQTTPVGTQATASGTSTDPSVAVAAATNDLVVDAVQTGALTLTVGAGQTQRWNNVTNSGAGSTKPGAATVTMSWSTPLSDDWVIAGVAIKDVAVAAGIHPPFPWRRIRLRS